jgi:sporulation protein YlmC with PRC-barrel domain
MVAVVDEGAPIAYQVLDEGVPVIASDGAQVGTVHHVVAVPEKDIFHGLVIKVPGSGRRFVAAADVGELHEHGVDLRIDSAAAHALPEPGGGAPVFDEDPATINRWSHWMNRLTGRSDWHRED